MELEHLYGVTVVHILVSFNTIIFMGRECISGLINENILGIGRITRWMVRVYSLGRMAGIIIQLFKDYIRDPIIMIRNMGMVNSIGQMDAVIKGIGQMVDNMAGECIKAVTVWRGKENGMKARNYDGWMNESVDYYTLLLLLC